MNINSYIFNASFFIFQDIDLNILMLGTMREKNLKGEKPKTTTMKKCMRKIIQLTEPELSDTQCVKTCPPCLLYLQFYNLSSYKNVFSMF